MGSLRPEPESTRREIPRDLIHDILVKLSTKDAARFSCVSRLWRGIVRDPSFRNAHAMASHVTSAHTEALLVSFNRKPGRSDEASVFNVSSGNAMCCVPILSGYGLANVCNDFLCFVHDNDPEAPAVVCNPVTGETVALPWAPPLVSSREEIWNLFALGFSSSTKDYKLFRLSYKSYSSSSENSVEMSVYTLGDSAGWRKHSFLSLYRPTDVSTPVLLQDKLYLLTIGWKHKYTHEIPKRILVIDVATESCCTYRLPDYETRPYDQPMVGIFELNGQLCFVAHLVDPTALRFWVMSRLGDKDLAGDTEPYWDLRYSFHRESFTFHTPWGCWLDDDETMFYRMNNTLHKYDTRNRPWIPKHVLRRWDKELQLPRAPSLSKCQWKVYGGYRPTLLSPLIFALPPSQDDDQSKHQHEHTILSLLRCHQ